MGLFYRFWSSLRGNASQSATLEQSALRLIDEGKAIEAEGRIDAAMSCYEEAIRLAPHLARAHRKRGRMLLALDRAESALEVCDCDFP